MYLQFTNYVYTEHEIDFKKLVVIFIAISVDLENNKVIHWEAWNIY